MKNCEMKTVIICRSAHKGCTAKIAGPMSEILEAEMFKPEDVSQEDIENFDVVGFGSGIYAGKFHRSMLSFVKGMREVKDKKAFVFSTSGEGGDRYNKPFKTLLLSKGFVVIGSFACKGFTTFGPLRLIGGINKGRPNKSDIESARDFAAGLKEKSGKN